MHGATDIVISSGPADGGNDRRPRSFTKLVKPGAIWLNGCGLKVLASPAALDIYVGCSLMDACPSKASKSGGAFVDRATDTIISPGPAEVVMNDGYD